jgi:pimeloyl-ACP methyl ester carboxylesterase
VRTELVSIPTETVPLEGALHEPDGKAAGAALLFHGNTMNFYVGAPRFLPPALTRLGLVCLAFNRRGHDILSTRNSRSPEGGAFQSTREAIADNRTAAAWLAARGFPAPVVIGHSNGGMLATQHVVDHPGTPALVLLSAGRGGRGAGAGTGGKERLFAADRMDELTEQARALVKAGRGRELMFLPGWWYVIAAESFLDRIETVPDTIALAPRIKCPVLCIRGDREEAHRYPAEAFQRAAGGPCRVEIIDNCDHFYNGREDHVAGTVASWLSETLNLTARTSTQSRKGAKED